MRYLHFGSPWVQGAMRIARPWALELDYTRDMMFALLLRPAHRWPRRVLAIGLGAGSIPKFLHRHFPHARIIVVEVSDAVVVAARQFFHLPDDPRRLVVIEGDGGDYVARSGSGFDLVLVDGFDGVGRAGILDTLPFYCNVAACLEPEGLCVVNLLDRGRGIGASVDRMRRAFAGEVLVLPESDGGNTIAIAAADAPIELSAGGLGRAGALLKERTGLDLRTTVSRLVEVRGLASGRAKR